MTTPRRPTLLIVGFGQLGMAVHREMLRRDTHDILATTRSLARAKDMRATFGIDTLLLRDDASADDESAGNTPASDAPAGDASTDGTAVHPASDAPHSAVDTLRAAVRADTDVVVSFPPDGASDAAFAPALRGARRIVYISTTGVFGAVSGHVDDDTPVDPNDARAAPRLHAEDLWRDVGAIVLRAPAIYSAGSGLHKRLLAGTHRLVEDGNRYVSRIHVDDLAVLALAALERAEARSTYVVGDHEPATQRAVVEFLCARLALPLPPAISASDAPPTLRGNRIVDGSRALRDLGVTLRYPSYREGYEAVLCDAGHV